MNTALHFADLRVYAAADDDGRTHPTGMRPVRRALRSMRRRIRGLCPSR